MTPEQIQEITHMNSQPVQLQFEASQVDVEKGIIRDIVVCEEGEAKGHGVSLDAQFISDLVEYDQKHHGEKGVKVRFDHPRMSAMGAQLGRQKNFRKRRGTNGKMQEIADLHLLQAAKQSPTHGDMWSWVLSMATEDPGFIMCSIVFRPSGYFQKKANGQKKQIWTYDDEDNYVPYDSKLGTVYVMFGEHHYTDLVDDGAATNSLFKNETPTPVIEKVAAEPQKTTFRMNLKEILFGKDKPTEDVAVTPEQVEELRGKVTTAETALSTATTDLATEKNKVKDLETSLATAKTELATAQARILELEKKPAATHTQGAAEGEQGKDEVKAWMKLPINEKLLKDGK